MTALLISTPALNGPALHGPALPGPARNGPTAAPAFVVLDGGRSGRCLAATYRRRRIVALILAAVVVLAAAVGARVALSAVTPQATPKVAVTSAAPAPEGPTVVVRAGDSLWSIARRLEPTGDVRALVDRLAVSRGITTLQPGQRIAIPDDR